MLVCTIYILVGMAITTTIIELVRYMKEILLQVPNNIILLIKFIEGSMQKAGEKCKSSGHKYKLNLSLLIL